MATVALPNIMVMKSFDQSDKGYTNYKSDNSVALGEQDVLSTVVMIAVERAKSDSRYVHLRFVYKNGYWAKNANDTFINVASKQPVEDIANPACTMFEPVQVKDRNQTIIFLHVQSGGRVRIDNNSTAFFVDVNAVPGQGYLTYSDWETLVKLPAHVAFKGDNGMYLQAITLKNSSVLQFASTNPSEKKAGHQVSQMKDGRVQITSDLYGKMWWSSNDWVYGDWSAQKDPESAIFTPLKTDQGGNTIALRSNGPYNSSKMCRRYTSSLTSCLAPVTSNITKEARLVVEEPVQARTIYDAVYDVANARTYNETPFVGGKAVLTNVTNKEARMAVGFTYQNETSYTFSRSLTLPTGVKTTFQIGLPLVENSKIVISPDINAILDWDTATAANRLVTVSGSVLVPAKSSVVVEYVGTAGTLNVPFSYSQKDVRSTDGATVITKQTDGIYTGVSVYNFSFQVVSTTPVTA